VRYWKARFRSKSTGARSPQWRLTAPDALIVSDHGEGIGNRWLIVDLVARARLPAMHSYRTFAEAGGLMAYGADDAESIRVVADYIDRIFKGATPGELPFQQASKFTLIVNLTTRGRTR
jgi:putative ABC transport system substrate-binding protein